MRLMRIALVAGHFMPEVGYQEVYLARAFSRLGHDVRVITSNRISPSGQAFFNVEDLGVGLTRDERYGYSILRLPRAVSVRSMVVARGVRAAVDKFDPAIVVAPGVGKLFASPVLVDADARRYKLLVLFSDNADFWDFRSTGLALASFRARLSQRVVKDLVYRRAVRFADRVCLQTPETQRIVSGSLPSRLRDVLERKGVLFPLGFDPDEFYFSAAEREDERRSLGLRPDERAFVTCTRVNPKKSLETLVDAFSAMHRRGHKLRYVIAGFSEDSYGDALRRYVDSQPDPSIFVCLPLLAHDRMRRVYCAADAGVWLKAAVSIQEAMGTGLPILLESKPSVEHLVRDGSNGWHFSPGKLVEGIQRAYETAEDRSRETIASQNRDSFSFDVIAHALLDSLESPPSATLSAIDRS